MKRFAGAWSLTLMASCSLMPTSPTTQLVVSFSEPTWLDTEDGRRALVVLTVENIGESGVFIGRCGDQINLTVDRYSGGGWVNYRYGACLAVLDMSSIELAPGNRETQSFALRDAGRYRVSFPVYIAHPCRSDPGFRCFRDDGPKSGTVRVTSDPG